ncbi:hypothetical protein [Calothrix rhizosoleniae]|uniref:hypothetical protein n=1 Tax=Calothrix rhizosoleniae TaxID=888997 RepID=UPI001F2833D5|nr:hypothetical protein [Calothrix rhizosoleniae]
MKKTKGHLQATSSLIGVIIPQILGVDAHQETGFIAGKSLSKITYVSIFLYVIR